MLLAVKLSVTHISRIFTAKNVHHNYRSSLPAISTPRGASAGHRTASEDADLRSESYSRRSLRSA